MVINKPQCGLDTCKYYFDGNCTNEKRYRTCEFTYLKTLEATGRLIEQKQGQWYPMHFGGVWQCSECSYLTNDNKATRYCPNCGAKMDEVKNERKTDQVIGKHGRY